MVYGGMIPSRGHSLSAGSLWEVNAAMLPRELCAQPNMGEPKVRTGPQAPLPDFQMLQHTGIRQEAALLMKPMLSFQLSRIYVNVFLTFRVKI